jgi:hypothetical protein
MQHDNVQQRDYFLCLYLSRQNTQSLRVMSLGEKIDRTQTIDFVTLPFPPFDLVTVPDQLPYIPRHGVHIATDIDDPLGIETDDLPEESRITPLSGRVDD